MPASITPGRPAQPSYKIWRFVGCTNRVFLDSRHVPHWIDGGETSRDHLVSSCHHHHFCASTATGSTSPTASLGPRLLRATCSSFVEDVVRPADMTAARGVHQRRSKTGAATIVVEECQTHMIRVGSMREDLELVGERIAEHAAHLDAAMHGLLTDIRTFDQGGGWADQGFRSCAHWLSWRIGLGLGCAREHVRVARRLGELPLIDESLRTGTVSYSKVRAMTRVATPANEATLLVDAQVAPAAQLETICRKYAFVQRHDADGSAAEEAERRYVTQRDTEDGMVRIEAVLHPEEAAIVWAALERVATERLHTEREPVTEPTGEFQQGRAASSGSSGSPQQHVPAGTPRVGSFDRAEALVAIAQDVVRGTSKDRSPIEVIVTVTRQALLDASAARSDHQRDPRSEPLDQLDRIACLPDGGGLSIEAARRLCCDAGIVEIVEDEQGTPLSVGRKTRSIPASIKRALLRRDKACRFPGCTNRVFLEGHHVAHWINGGETRLDNLISICSHHHRFVHEHGYRIDLADGEPRFFDHRGRIVPDVPPPPRPAGLGWDAILASHAQLGITAETGACAWDGAPIDYSLVIDELSRADGY